MKLDLVIEQPLFVNFCRRLDCAQSELVAYMLVGEQVPSTESLCQDFYGNRVIVVAEPNAFY